MIGKSYRHPWKDGPRPLALFNGFPSDAILTGVLFPIFLISFFWVHKFRGWRVRVQRYGKHKPGSVPKNGPNGEEVEAMGSRCRQPGYDKYPDPSCGHYWDWPRFFLGASNRSPLQFFFSARPRCPPQPCFGERPFSNFSLGGGIPPTTGAGRQELHYLSGPNFFVLFVFVFRRGVPDLRHRPRACVFFFPRGLAAKPPLFLPRFVNTPPPAKLAGKNQFPSASPF